MDKDLKIIYSIWIFAVVSSILILPLISSSPALTDNIISYWKVDEQDTTGTGTIYGNGSQLTDLPAGSESDPQWTANSTLVGYLASNNKWTENQNMTNQNITDVQCINFQNGALWCGV